MEAFVDLGYHSIVLFDAVAQKDASIAPVLADLVASLTVEDDAVVIPRGSKGWAALKKLCESSNKTVLAELSFFIAALSSDGSTLLLPLPCPKNSRDIIETESIFFIFVVSICGEVLCDQPTVRDLS